MCSLRGLWLFRADELILSRRFPTVERRVRLAQAAPGEFGAAVLPYEKVALPDDREVAAAFFARTEDRAGHAFLRPVMSLRAGGSLLWPMVAVVDSSRAVAACALPFADGLPLLEE
eukprot:PLAT4242.1.p1 GENE.PLAT4242.1~~PLAT4242.1.p1  ORF type:complete len:124 (+),score=4.51 PLAT4242.1:26-373(+)